jgi:hypothetical protein
MILELFAGHLVHHKRDNNFTQPTATWRLGGFPTYWDAEETFLRRDAFTCIRGRGQLVPFSKRLPRRRTETIDDQRARDNTMYPGTWELTSTDLRQMTWEFKTQHILHSWFDRSLFTFFFSTFNTFNKTIQNITTLASTAKTYSSILSCVNCSESCWCRISPYAPIESNVSLYLKVIRISVQGTFYTDVILAHGVIMSLFLRFDQEGGPVCFLQVCTLGWVQYIRGRFVVGCHRSKFKFGFSQLSGDQSEGISLRFMSGFSTSSSLSGSSSGSWSSHFYFFRQSTTCMNILTVQNGTQHSFLSLVLLLRNMWAESVVLVRYPFSSCHSLFCARLELSFGYFYVCIAYTRISPSTVVVKLFQDMKFPSP